MTGRIVVGVDGSEGSRQALAWAVNEAAVRGAVVEAVNVWQSPYDHPQDFDFSYPVDEKKLVERARVQLVEAIEQVAGEHGEVEVRSRVLRGDPAATLCARAAKADMLVVGSRGHGTFSELLLGSVSAKCARHSTAPVVIVRTGRDELASGPGPPVEPPRT